MNGLWSPWWLPRPFERARRIPGTISRVENLILDKLDTEVYTRPTTPPGGGGYPMRCARKAATVPNLRLKIREEIEERLQNIFRDCFETLEKSCEHVIQHRIKNLENEIQNRSGCSWAEDGPKLGQVGSKLRLRWPRMAPRRRYVGRPAASDGQLGTILKHFRHLGPDLCENSESVKTNSPPLLLLDS